MRLLDSNRTTSNSSLEINISREIGVSHYGYIYLTRNKVNGHSYVGKHKLNGDNSYIGSGKNICSAIKKYGKDNFTNEILQYCNSLEELNLAEMSWIKKLRSEGECHYNISDGGDGGDIFSKLTPEQQEHVREVCGKTQLGVVWDDERKEKMRQKQLGKVRSEETKLHMSIAQKGKKRSKESVEKTASKLRGRKQSQELIDKRVNSRKLNGNYSMSELTKQKLSEIGRKHRHTEVTKQVIGECSKGRKWITNGIINKFVKGSELEQLLNKDFVYGRI